MSNDMAKRFIEGIKQYQNGGRPEQIFPCPRCGMEIETYMALSRKADVYICSDCGLDEALRDFSGVEDMPFSMWAMAL